jgi:carboxylesterase
MSRDTFNPQQPDPTPFLLAGGDVGVLLIHGFTGSPAEMRPLGHHLHERGLTVAAPLLTGHGTTPADLNRQRRQDWIACVEQALAELQTQCQRVFMAGLSLGALLTLTVAARRRELAGIITYSPAVIVNDPRAYFVAILKYLMPTLAKPLDYFADPAVQSLMWSYPVYPVAAAHETMKLIGEVKRALPEVACPLLVIYSRSDATIHPRSAQFVYDRVRSTDKAIIALQASGHVITLDCEWQQVAEESYRFVQQRS